MSRKRRQRRDADGPKYHPLAFGGWGDYKTWAEHQFLPKPIEDSADDDARDVDATDVDATQEETRGDPPEPRFDGDGHHGDGHHGAGIFPDTGPVPDAGPAPATDQGLPGPYLVQHPQDSLPVKARPYVLTGGRTRGNELLRIDSLISVTPEGAWRADDPALPQEYRWLFGMCQEPMAVIEIAGRLRLPIGVVLVLISDAIGWNLLRAHPVAEVDGQPSVELIMRVHEGLRRLR
ncbi:DUF742 domain-containing protein [Streptosporangium sp. NPDC002544]|uniref:DUF742 domain-containing protein n=1 Tax=Streptosporangium sp. NPDC002544 TaxID=3154538 RepID=UPI00332A8E98